MVSQENASANGGFAIVELLEPKQRSPVTSATNKSALVQSFQHALPEIPEFAIQKISIGFPIYRVIGD